MKIKIKGEFTIEMDNGMMNNVKQPLSYLELEVFEMTPFRLNAFTSKNLDVLSLEKSEVKK